MRTLIGLVLVFGLGVAIGQIRSPSPSVEKPAACCCGGDSASGEEICGGGVTPVSVESGDNTLLALAPRCKRCGNKCKCGAICRCPK